MKLSLPSKWVILGTKDLPRSKVRHSHPPAAIFVTERQEAGLKSWVGFLKGSFYSGPIFPFKVLVVGKGTMTTIPFFRNIQTGTEEKNP